MPPHRINEIVHGKRAITADTALRLGRFFDTTVRFWINLQNRYDLERATDALGDRLNKEVSPHAACSMKKRLTKKLKNCSATRNQP